VVIILIIKVLDTYIVILCLRSWRHDAGRSPGRTG
jgi:hypothetical protein